jgi:hypothetical protein
MEFFLMPFAMLNYIAFVMFLSRRKSHYTIKFVAIDKLPDLPLQTRKTKRRTSYYLNSSSCYPVPWKFFIFDEGWVLAGSLWIASAHLVIHWMKYWLFTLVAHWLVSIMTGVIMIIWTIICIFCIFSPVFSFLMPIEERWIREYIQQIERLNDE